ncbi:MAG: hypothetical protein ACPGVU_08215 [Limisphaerales bacterium]
MEAVQRDYSPKGVKFYYVYKALAHPEKDGYVQPFTLKERLLHVAEAEKRIDTGVTWICDNMDNELVTAMGMAPNSEFIINPAGEIVRKRAWSDPKAVRRDLEELVGEVDNPTTLTAKDIRTIPVENAAAKGVVKRITVPRNLRPIVVEPELQFDDTPFYVKLRADADPKLLMNGKGEGKLYLGFFLDPIYHVHWNNQVDPIRVEIDTPVGISAVPAKLQGPKVNEASDVDPREFLVHLTATSTNEPIKLTVHYFGCNDAEGWCMPIRQRYAVHLHRDLHSGWPANRMHHKAPLDAPPPKPRSQSKSSTAQTGRANQPANSQNMLMGQVVQIDTEKGEFKIRDRNGKEHTLIVPDNLQLIRDGKRARFNELAKGDRVRLQFSPSKNGNPVVLRIQVRRSR